MALIKGALVDLENGEWRFLHFQDAGSFGRIVHMQPVRWEDGWPLMGVDHDKNGIGEPVASGPIPALGGTLGGPSPVVIPQTSDEFDDLSPGLQWQWQANHNPSWSSLTARPGWLRLFSRPVAAGGLVLTPSLLMQKFPARRFSAETLVDLAPGANGISGGISGGMVIL